MVVNTLHIKYANRKASLILTFRLFGPQKTVNHVSQKSMATFKQLNTLGPKRITLFNWVIPLNLNSDKLHFGNQFGFTRITHRYTNECTVWLTEQFPTHEK